MFHDPTEREVPMEVYAGIDGDKIEYVFVGQLGDDAQKSTIAETPP